MSDRGFFGGALTAVKEWMSGDTWWLASDTTEVVEIPAKYLTANHVELEREDELILLKGTYTGGVLYHVAIVKDGRTYSIWRNELLAATQDLVRSVAPFTELSKYIDNVKDIKMLLSHIGKHPLWKPVHIAARMDLQGFFQDAHANGSLPSLLQQSCQPEGRYALHLVVFYNRVELAKKLISYGASVAQTDAKGRTALHYGARTTPAMLEVLCAQPEAKKCINALSSDGYTPLFIAVLSLRPHCIIALVRQGAILNITCQGRSALHVAVLQNNAKVQAVIQTLVQACPESVTEMDPLTGNSLLHTATNKKSLRALIAVSPTIDKNVKNKSGQTALHWHVQKGDLGMVVTLITLGVDVDATDNDGNTALHLAVSRGNIDIVKALLVLGSNANVVNSYGDSPFHMAARMKHKHKFDIIHCLIICGAQQCPPSIRASISEPNLAKQDQSGVGVFASTTEALSELDQFIQRKCVENIERLCDERNKSGKKENFETVLSLDGGGIRGLVLVQTLLALERELGGEPILKYIDWLAGTSTGALMAAALAKGKTLRECQHMYLQFKDEIFDGWVRPYNTEVLEKFVTVLTGTQTTMADIKQPRLIITTTAADKIPIKLHLFRNYQLPVDKAKNEAFGYVDPADKLLWKALRCSSAAPTYFSSVDNKFVDGGLAANNPLVEVLSEIQRFNNALEYTGKPEEQVKVGCAISIGTGVMPDIPAESLNFGGVESMTAIRTFGLMFIQQACATEGGPVELARAWLQKLGAPLYRLNPLLSKEYMLDTKDDKEIISMIWEVEEYARAKASEFRELAKFLKTIKG